MKVAVIGSGVMGPGIAQVWLMGGNETTLVDISEDALREGVKDIRKSLLLMHEMGIIERDVEQYMSLLTATSSLEQAVQGARLVIEVVPERPDIKQAIYDQLDRFCPRDTVIVSNTSALPLPDMFPDFRPDKFFVCHFFNPPQIIPLVELVKNDRTDNAEVLWLKNELTKCGKKPIIINGFVKGFVANRLQMALGREALHLIDSGVVQPEDIDTAVLAAIGFKSAWQGMFDTMDYIGIDTVALVSSILYPDLCNGTTIPEVITQKVSEGHLGVKTGQGFFSYEGDKASEIMKKRQTQLLEQLRLWKKYMD